MTLTLDRREYVSHHKILLTIAGIILLSALAPPAAKVAVNAVRDVASKGDFDAAFKFVLEKEGGYANNAADSGGATMKGVTQATYDAYRQGKGQGSQGVSSISEEELKEVYKDYWRQGNCDRMDNPLALACLDSVINFGVGGGKSFFGDLPKDPKQAALEVVKRRKAYRNERVSEKPSQRVFLQGWLSRDESLESVIKKGSS